MRLILLIFLFANITQAETLQWDVPVVSQVNQKYEIQVTVTGTKEEESEKVKSLVESATKEIASQYTKEGLIQEGRQWLFNRVEKRMKKQNLSQDGMGVIVLTKKDGKVIEVD